MGEKVPGFFDGVELCRCATGGAMAGTIWSLRRTDDGRMFVTEISNGGGSVYLLVGPLEPGCVIGERDDGRC